MWRDMRIEMRGQDIEVAAVDRAVEIEIAGGEIARRAVGQNGNGNLKNSQESASDYRVILTASNCGLIFKLKLRVF